MTRSSRSRHSPADAVAGSGSSRFQTTGDRAGISERIHLHVLDVVLEGKNGQHRVDFENGEWRCDCEYFRTHHSCSHMTVMKGMLTVKALTDVEAAPEPATVGVRASLASRVHRWLAGSLNQMSDEEVLKLIEAQSPAETIAEVLAATNDTHHIRDSDWTELLLRGAESKSRVAEFAGGLLSPLEAARVLNISVPGVKQRLERRKLLAVPLPGGQRGFPAFQFERDGRVRTGVPEVAAAGAHLDPWVLLSILVDEVEGEAGGTLLERLSDEAVRADALSRIASYGEHGAA